MNVALQSGLNQDKVRAIAAWSAQNDWQLTFDVGELIMVLDKFEGKTEYEGWYQGKIGEEVGLFPVSYTEPYKSKDFSVKEKKISQLVANLQKQCGFIKSEGIAELKKEFNDLQKELAITSPVKPKPPTERKTENSEKLSPKEQQNPTGGKKSPDNIETVAQLKKDIEDLKKKSNNDIKSNTEIISQQKKEIEDMKKKNSKNKILPIIPILSKRKSKI